VLTFSCAKAISPSRLAAFIPVAAVLSVMAWNAAGADGMAIGRCDRASTGAVNCLARWGEAGDPHIRIVPQPADDAAKTRAAERDRKWQDRCQPVIAQDRYGVSRYRYSAPGCEFGVIE